MDGFPLFSEGRKFSPHCGGLDFVFSKIRRMDLYDGL